MTDSFGLIVIFLPLIMIVLLANLAERERLAQRDNLLLVLATYASTVGTLLLLFLGGIVLQFIGTLATGGPPPEAADELYRSLGFSADAMAETFASLPLIGFGLWFPALVGMVLLLPPVRRLFGRIVPQFDPASHVHAVALSLSVLIVVNLLTTLGVGLDTLAEGLAASGEDVPVGSIIGNLWIQQLLTALLAVLGVGWLVRRDTAAVMARLKLTRPTQRQLLAACGLALLMVPVVAGLALLGAELGWDNADVEALTEELLGDVLLTIPGILTVGLAAALGEETFFRGALQPRFGRFLTALLFALLHGNYGLSLATLAVFLLGYVLGVVRDRANTTTAMVVHAVYNMTLGVLTYIGAGAF